VSIAVVAGLIGTLAMLHEARRQEEVAIEQRSLAERRAVQASDAATRARVVSEFLEKIIISADPYRQVKADPKLSDVLQFAVTQLDSGTLSTQPEAEASLQVIVAQTLGRLGDDEKAEQLLRRAVEYRHTQSPRDPMELARSIMLLGNALTNQSKYVEAETCFRDASKFAEAVNDRQLEGAIQFNIATSLMSQLRYAEAKPLLEALLPVRRERFEQAPLELAELLDTLGQTEIRLEHADRAINLLCESMEIRDQFEPADALSRAETSTLLAEALSALKQNDLAILVLEEAIDRVKGRAAEFSGTTAMMYETLGRRHALRKDHQRAAELIAKALEIRLSVDGPSHLRTARAHVQLGELLFALGKQDESRDQFRTAWSIVKDRPDYPMQARVEAASQLAALSREGDKPTAIELFEFSLRYYRSLPKRVPQHYRTAMNYFSNRYLAADYSAALPIAEELLSVAMNVYDENGPEVGVARSYVARANLKALGGDVSRAHSQAREAMGVFEKSGQRGSPLWLSAQSLLGEALTRLGRLDEASLALESTLAAFRAIQNPSPQVERAILDTEDRLSSLHQAQERVSSSTPEGVFR
jgi:tetratricopeptide (TPR) repeat protein